MMRKKSDEVPAQCGGAIDEEIVVRLMEAVCEQARIDYVRYMRSGSDSDQFQLVAVELFFLNLFGDEKGAEVIRRIRATGAKIPTRSGSKHGRVHAV